MYEDTDYDESSANRCIGDESNRDARAVTTRVDTIVYVLAHQRRRDAVRYLRAADGPVEVDEVVSYVTARALTGYPDRSDELAESITTDLRENHLPKLVHSPVLERDGETVRYVGDRRVEAVLDVLSTFEPTEGVE